MTNSDGGNGADLYLEFEIKSFAVRVESSANTSSEVTIIAGEIMNTIGGGLYVGGGNVILGDEKGNGPTIQTSERKHMIVIRQRSLKKDGLVG